MNTWCAMIDLYIRSLRVHAHPPHAHSVRVRRARVRIRRCFKWWSPRQKRGRRAAKRGSAHALPPRHRRKSSQQRTPAPDAATQRPSTRLPYASSLGKTQDVWQRWLRRRCHLAMKRHRCVVSRVAFMKRALMTPPARAAAAQLGQWGAASPRAWPWAARRAAEQAESYSWGGMAK